MTTRKVVALALFLAISVVVSYVESFIPLGIPGVKLGLANVIILVLLYEDSIKNALLILLLRIFLVGFIRGTFLTPTWFMSLGGGMSAFLMMMIFSRIKIFSAIGSSVVGSVFHCVGQILVAMALLTTVGVVYYLPWIALLSLLTGIFSGFLTLILRGRYHEFMYS